MMSVHSGIVALKQYTSRHRNYHCARFFFHPAGQNNQPCLVRIRWKINNIHTKIYPKVLDVSTFEIFP